MEDMSKRPDQSMSLLADVRNGALEPEYAQATSKKRGDSALVRVVVVGALAALLAIAAVQTTRSASDVEAERAELIELASAQQERLTELGQEVAALNEEISRLSESQLTDPQLQSDIEALEPITGAVPVAGPGIVIVADDAPNRTDNEGMVLDSDLSRLVNGLWQAGAEAIAINGRRVTASTPIRSAGAAITVDYVSLSPPYRVEAIGDPGRLQARFGRTAAASWWFYLASSYGIGFEVTAASGDLELAAQPRMQLTHAKKGE